MFDDMEEAFKVKGYDQMEVYAEEESSVECSVSDDRVDSVDTEDSRGIGVRVLVDNSVGFAYTTDIESVESTARRAVKLARLSQFETISFPVKTSFPEVEGVYDRETAGLTEEDITVKARRAIEYDGVYFSGGAVSKVAGTSYIMNSAGIEEKQKATYFVAFLTANKDGRSKHWFDASRKVFDVDDVAGEAVRILEKSLNPVKIEKGRRPVVLTPYAQYQIFSGILYPAFNADRVQRGKSPLKDRRGEAIASKTLSMSDNGLLEGGINTRPFDREGSPAQMTQLIAEGTLKEFLYDVQRAEKEGRESTGNAVGGYRNFPHIGPKNMVLEGEMGSVEELDDAVIIHDVAGVHTANETSGDFSLNITTGFHREGGEEKSIEGGLFVGNMFDLLEDHTFFYGEPRMVDSLTSRPAVFLDQQIVN